MVLLIKGAINEIAKPTTDQITYKVKAVILCFLFS